MVIQPSDDPPYLVKRRRKPLPPADLKAATAAAAETLAHIDWSRPTLVLWMNGTGDEGGQREFTAAAKQAWAGTASIARVVYPASYDYRASVATGIEALRQVLEGIRAHGGSARYRLVIGGESQGAWVVGDTLADPRMRQLVQRAVLVGHPSIAATHYHDDRDADIVEINHREDLITTPAAGDVEGALDAVGALVTRKDPRGIGKVLGLVANNPILGLKFLQNTATGLIFGSSGKSAVTHDTHNYRDHMQYAVDFLRAPSVSEQLARLQARGRRSRARIPAGSV